MPRIPTPTDAIDVPRLVSALRRMTDGETTTRLHAAVDPRVGQDREVSLDLVPAWRPELRAAELARNERAQQALDRDAGQALHHEVDIPRWRRLTRMQMALVVERALNTESEDLPVGRTVVLSNPLGRALEFVRTPSGWERLRPLPDLDLEGVTIADRGRGRIL